MVCILDVIATSFLRRAGAPQLHVFLFVGIMQNCNKLNFQTCFGRCKIVTVSLSFTSEPPERVALQTRAAHGVCYYTATITRC